MKYYLLLLSFLFGYSVNSQTWNNLNYSENQRGLELNPLKGFATLWQPSNTFPHSIQGKLFGLDEVMIGIDNFNWTPMDNFLAQEANKGNHAYLQVNIDPAFGNSAMPPFLVNQVEFQYYDDGNVPDLCPDWNDPDLMEAMLNFIDAFGAKYDKDDRVFLVHLGLYGMWGEWHIGSVGDIRPEFEMTEANKTLIANTYKNAFREKLLLARYPENMPDPQLFGYSDGLFFGQSLHPTNPWYFHNTLKTNKADLNWKLYPIGGEIDPGLQVDIFDILPNRVGQDIFASLDAIRPTWLFCHHILTEAQPSTAEWNNAIRIQKAMGYSFYIDQYRLSAANGHPAIEVNIQNKGIAPMYANWDIEFGVLNANKQFQSLGFTKGHLNLIQPATPDNYRSFVSDTTLVDGTYTFLLRVINPLATISTKSQPVRFANTTQDKDIEGWITLGTATISSGNADITPIKITDISLNPTSKIMQDGETIQLLAEVLPANATNSTITWVSDHPATASVNANGLVMAHSTSGTAIINAFTQDGGFKAESIITVEPNRVTLPAFIEAEDYTKMSGIVVENASEGGFNLGYIDKGDWIEYAVLVASPSDFFVDFRVASQPGGGEISLMDKNGETLAVLSVPGTNGWQNYTTITSHSISLPAGTNTLRIQASEGGFNLNWIEFRNNLTSSINDAPNFKNLIRLSPNPTQNNLILDWDTQVVNIPLNNIRLFNTFGADVTPFITNNREINLGHLPSGVYFLTMEIAQGKIIKKVIKN